MNFNEWTPCADVNAVKHVVEVDVNDDDNVAQQQLSKPFNVNVNVNVSRTQNMVMTKLNTTENHFERTRKAISFHLEHFEWSQTCTTRNYWKKRTYGFYFGTRIDLEKKHSDESMVPIAIFHCIHNDSKLGFFSFVFFLSFFIIVVVVSLAVQSTAMARVSLSRNWMTHWRRATSNYTVFVHHFGWICHWNISP